MSLLFGCGEPAPADAYCRVASHQTSLPPAAAACVIDIGTKLVTLKLSESGQFTLPIGEKDPSLSAQCTAHKATWQQTGFNVEIGALLGEDVSGREYFHCHLDPLVVGDLDTLPTPSWANPLFEKIDILDPYTLEPAQWHEQDNFIHVLDFFTAPDVSLPK